MPVYEYRCNACGKEFEYQQRMSDPEKTTCEACGKEELERLISRTAFSLKGGGWYKDLYASTKPESPAGSSGEAKPAASSDTAAASPSATPAAPAPAAPKSDSGSGSSGGGSGSSSGGGSTAASAS